MKSKKGVQTKSKQKFLPLFLGLTFLSIVTVGFVIAISEAKSRSNDMAALSTSFPSEQITGGIWIPFDKFGLLTPYIGLASTILVATVSTRTYDKCKSKHRKKRNK